MRRIILFNMITLDGCFEGPKGETDWHNADEEFNRFAMEQLENAGTLLFGRKTYQLMEAHWPSPLAARQSPVIAAIMNNMDKVVCSKTLLNACWSNSQVVNNNVKAEVLRLKQQAGKDIMIFGSANLSASLIKEGLIDEFRVMVNPVVMGKGKSLFKGINGRLNLQLLKVRMFNSGNILLHYKPLYN